MLNQASASISKWYRKKAVYEIFVDQLIILGIAYTIIRAIGDHSVLHELLADTTLMLGPLGILATKPLKWFIIGLIGVAIMVALCTGGFS